MVNFIGFTVFWTSYIVIIYFSKFEKTKFNEDFWSFVRFYW